MNGRPKNDPPNHDHGQGIGNSKRHGPAPHAVIEMGGSIWGNRRARHLLNVLDFVVMLWQWLAR
eukprot:8495972-Alexandrium_andersonii.AAC.1